jgi:hypothetical protein
MENALKEHELEKIRKAGPGALAPAGHTVATVQGDAMFFNPVLFEHAQRVATMLSKSELVPKHFQNNVANCMIALNLAGRMRIDAFGLMQSLYIVHGRPGVEGKLAISLINGSGRFSPIQYKTTESGKKTEKEIPRWDSCQAYATNLRTGEVIHGPVITWQMAVAEGWTKPKGSPPNVQTSKWQTLPDLMFSYRSAMFFCRVHCPELLIGMRTIDELDDIVEMAPARNGSFEKAPEKAPLTPEGELQLAQAVKKFDKKIPKGTDKESFNKFLEDTARANNLSVEDLKANVVENNSMEALLGYYEKWTGEPVQTDPAQAQEAEAKEEDVPEFAPGPCPNNPDTTYKKAVCDGCPSRTGCLAWKA